MKRALVTALIPFAFFFACGDDEDSQVGAEDDSADDGADDTADAADDNADDGADDAADDSADDADDSTDDSADDSADDAGSDMTIVLEGMDGGVPVTFTGEGVACGDERCQGVEVGGDFNLEVEGCCADKGESLCGLNLEALGLLLNISDPGCEPLDLPGSSDPSCPESAEIPNGLSPDEPLVFPGCCQQNGKCGFDTSFQGVGFGCVDPQRFTGQEPGGDCEYTP